MLKRTMKGPPKTATSRKEESSALFPHPHPHTACLNLSTDIFMNLFMKCPFTQSNLLSASPISKDHHTQYIDLQQSTINFQRWLECIMAWAQHWAIQISLGDWNAWPTKSNWRIERLTYVAEENLHSWHCYLVCWFFFNLFTIHIEITE